MSNIEKLLNALKTGEDVSGFIPQSRQEEILKRICLKESLDDLTPLSRVEYLLIESAKNMASSGGGGEVGDGYKIRYIDVDGTVLKTEYVESGGKLNPPNNPTYDSEYLEFDTWNYDIDNYVVNRNTDIGAIYKTKTGDSYLFIRLTENTGLTIPTMDILVGGKIDWGDGTVDTNKTHTYTDYGDYIIKISKMHTISRLLTSQSSYYVLLKCYLGDTVHKIYEYAFNSCYSLTNISIPNRVTNIGDRGFNTCRSLTNVNIPNSVTNIGDYAFNSCYSLTNVSIPNSVTNIGNEIFGYCHSLTNVNIPNTVTSIGYCAFQYCYSLTNVIIPDTVTSIGHSAFQYCYVIKHYVLKCSSVPTLPYTSTFKDINKVATIWVKDELVEEYKSATNWSTYTTYIKPISLMSEKLRKELGLV